MCAFRARIRLPQKLIFCSAVECMGRIQEWEFDVFLQIVESKNIDGAGFDRHAIVVFQDEMQTFLQGLNESLEFIEKKRKEQLKEKREKKQRTTPADTASTEKKKVINKRNTSTKPARKVRIVKKDDAE